jgi:hypothetical protein
VRFDTAGLHVRGGAHFLPWSSVDRVEVELPTRDSTRLRSITVRTARGTGRARYAHPAARHVAAQLLSAVRTSVPRALLLEWSLDEAPRSDEERQCRSASLARKSNELRTVLWILGVCFVAVVGHFAQMFVRGSPSVLDEGHSTWFLLAFFATGIGVVASYAFLFGLPLWLVARQYRAYQRQLRLLEVPDDSTHERNR